MSKRHRDALAINDGACNPTAIVLSMKAAIEEIRETNTDTDAILMDAAFRLMVHQLSWITRSGAVTFEFMDYSAAVTECEEAKSK
jgi:hypothetical protein